MMPLQDIIKINSDELLLDVIKDRGKNDKSEIPVIENGNCIGILNHNNILQFIFELHKLGH